MRRRLEVRSQLGEDRGKESNALHTGGHTSSCQSQGRGQEWSNPRVDQMDNVGGLQLEPQGLRLPLESCNMETNVGTVAIVKINDEV